MDKRAVITICLLLFTGLINHRVVSAQAPRRSALPSISAPDALPGLQLSAAPWPAERRHLRERLAALGLPALAEEGNTLHTHQHLHIVVDGEPVLVPGGIGIDAAELFIAPIHTHDSSGVIHIESPTVEDFTLGQFFDIWGVRLTSTCLGAYCTQGEKALRIFINGQPLHGDPRAHVLAPHEEIVMTHGRLADVPKPMPSRYDFPTGW